LLSCRLAAVAQVPTGRDADEARDVVGEVALVGEADFVRGLVSAWDCTNRLVLA